MPAAQCRTSLHRHSDKYFRMIKCDIKLAVVQGERRKQPGTTAELRAMYTDCPDRGHTDVLISHLSKCSDG